MEGSTQEVQLKSERSSPSPTSLSGKDTRGSISASPLPGSRASSAASTVSVKAEGQTVSRARHTPSPPSQTSARSSPLPLNPAHAVNVPPRSGSRQSTPSLPLNTGAAAGADASLHSDVSRPPSSSALPDSALPPPVPSPTAPSTASQSAHNANQHGSGSYFLTNVEGGGVFPKTEGLSRAPLLISNTTTAPAAGWSPLSSPMPLGSNLGNQSVFLFPPLSPAINSQYATPLSSPHLPSAKRATDSGTPMNADSLANAQLTAQQLAGLMSSSPSVYDSSAMGLSAGTAGVTQSQGGPNQMQGFAGLPPLGPGSPFSSGWMGYPISPLILPNSNNSFLSSVSEGGPAIAEGIPLSKEELTKIQMSGYPNALLNSPNPYKTPIGTSSSLSTNSTASSHTDSTQSVQNMSYFGLPHSVYNATHGTAGRLFTAPNSLSLLSPAMRGAEGSLTEHSTSSPGTWAFGRRGSYSDRSSPRSQLPPASPISAASPSSPAAALQHLSALAAASPQLPSLYHPFPPSPISKLPAQASAGGAQATLSAPNNSTTFYWNPNASLAGYSFSTGLSGLPRPYDSSASSSHYSGYSTEKSEDKSPTEQSITFTNSQSTQNIPQRPRSMSNSSANKRKSLTKLDTGGGAKAQKSSNAAKKRKGKQEASENNYKSDIECGVLVRQSSTGREQRMSSMHLDFFGRQVKVYTATKDPVRRVLVKASDLSSHLNCTNNMLAMYLSRRKKEKNSGIFQATGINFKSESRKDLKQGGYFVSLEACEAFKMYKDKKTVPR